MARNDQATRQWHPLRCLENPKGATLGQLIAAIPDDFPKNGRTVRRDLDGLASAGFPVTTERHNGQTRLRLLEGASAAPALGFSATELMALLLSRNLLKPLKGTELAEALNSALSKASAALPPQGHDYVRAMESIFSVGLGPHKKYAAHRATIDLISQAIDKRRTAQMRYFSASRGSAGRREVDPYFLRFAAGRLYMIGHCHLRKKVRMFAVERIRSITLTDHPFQLALGFNVDEYVQDALGIMQAAGRLTSNFCLPRKPRLAARQDRRHPACELNDLNDA